MRSLGSSFKLTSSIATLAQTALVSNDLITELKGWLDELLSKYSKKHGPQNRKVQALMQVHLKYCWSSHNSNCHFESFLRWVEVLFNQLQAKCLFSLTIHPELQPMHQSKVIVRLYSTGRREGSGRVQSHYEVVDDDC